MTQDSRPDKQIDPSKIKIGDIILMASGTRATIRIQEKYGYGASSRWTHVAGSLGGHDLVEGQVPRSRTCNLQRDYIAKNIEIKVLRKKHWPREKDRIKVALWWATMNNTPYDFPQLLNFLVGFSRLGRAYVSLHNLFDSHKKLICSELIINGFFKEGYNLFNKPAWNILPADFDNAGLFDEIADVWVEAKK